MGTDDGSRKAVVKSYLTRDGTARTPTGTGGIFLAIDSEKSKLLDKIASQKCGNKIDLL